MDKYILDKAHAWNPITNNEYILCGYAFEVDGIYY